MNITLSESSLNFVNRKVAELGLSAPEEFLEWLVEEREKKELDEYYYAKCKEAIDENKWTTITPENSEEFWNSIKQDVRNRLRERQGKEFAK